MVRFNKEKVTIEDFYRILYQNEEIEFSTEVIDAVTLSFDFLKEFSKDKIIYGINTGLGPMAQYKIEESDQIESAPNICS